MVSLTTVYIISVLLSSIAAMGSAFASESLVGGPPANTEQTLSEVPQADELRSD